MMSISLETATRFLAVHMITAEPDTHFIHTPRSAYKFGWLPWVCALVLVAVIAGGGL